ncbi:MAG: hypothetical protein KHX40_13050, partial [Oscillospiraceae bacterium]|nr:hypothetical protein [Oscillospiraceae bacterium]
DAAALHFGHGLLEVSSIMCAVPMMLVRNYAGIVRSQSSQYRGAFFDCIISSNTKALLFYPVYLQISKPPAPAKCSGVWILWNSMTKSQTSPVRIGY